MHQTTINNLVVAPRNRPSNMSSTNEVMPLLLVTWMKSSKRWIHSYVESKKTQRVLPHVKCRVDSICDCNIGNKGDTANTASSSINVDSIGTKYLVYC